MKDENRRRAYDLIYPSIAQRRPSPQSTQTPRPAPASTPQRGPLNNEAAEIAALEKSKRERAARWQTKRSIFDSSIFELQRSIRRLRQEISNLDSIFAAEAAVEAQKNSWETWLLSPLFKKAEESEEDKARKDREKQERRLERDMKERRLDWTNVDLGKEQNLYKQAEAEVKAADLCDDRKRAVLQARIQARERKQREERERLEKERLEKMRKQQQEEWKKQYQEAMERERLEKERQEKIRKQQQEQWEKQYQEAMEKARKQQAERRAAEQKRQAAEKRRQATCRHDGWWPKIEERRACPSCDDVWTYLLQCPGCKIMACPKCQADIRPRGPRGAARN